MSTVMLANPNRMDDTNVIDGHSQNDLPLTQDSALLHFNYNDDTAISTHERAADSEVVTTPSSKFQP